MQFTCYKRKEDGRILMLHPHSRRVFMAATTTLPTIYSLPSYWWNVDDLVNRGILEHIDIRSIKWLHPHLIKVVREHIDNNIGFSF